MAVAVGSGRKKRVEREPPGADGCAELSAKFDKIPTKFFFLGVSLNESTVGVALRHREERSDGKSIDILEIWFILSQDNSQAIWLA